MHHTAHNEHLANVFERAASAAGRLGGADSSSWQNKKRKKHTYNAFKGQGKDIFIADYFKNGLLPRSLTQNWNAFKKFAFQFENNAGFCADAPGMRQCP